MLLDSSASLTNDKKFSSTNKSSGSTTGIRQTVEPRGKFVKPYLWLSNSRKKIAKLMTILYNWKTADQVEAKISLNNRAKEADNMPRRFTAQYIELL